MTWTFTAHRGSANNKTSGTTISVSPNAPIDAGGVLVVRCSADNYGTTSGESTEHVSVTDSKGNSYSKIREQRYSAGAAADGVVGSIWISKLTVSLQTTDTVTLTFANAVTAKAIGLELFSMTKTDISITGKNGASQASTTLPTVTLSGLASAEYLWLGMVATEGPNGDTFTQDTDYANNTSFGTTGGTAATNVSNRYGSRVYTGTSDTYNPTLGTARDVVTVLGAIQETGALQSIVSKAFPMTYLHSPPSAKQCTSKVSGETVTQINKDFPAEMYRAGKAKELRSRWT